MKKKLILGVLFIFSIGILQSCLKTEEEKADERRVARFKKILKTRDDKNIYPGGQVVSKDLAQRCVLEYDKLYKPAVDTEAMQFAFTEDVSFGINSLTRWIVDMSDSTDADNIRVFYGIYTEEMAAAYPNHPVYPGRVTVFLWPFKGARKAIFRRPPGGGDQDTVGAYNLGNVYP